MGMAGEAPASDDRGKALAQEFGDNNARDASLTRDVAHDMALLAVSDVFRLRKARG
jgi:hypothetical protein